MGTLQPLKHLRVENFTGKLGFLPVAGAIDAVFTATAAHKKNSIHYLGGAYTME